MKQSKRVVLEVIGPRAFMPNVGIPFHDLQPHDLALTSLNGYPNLPLQQHMVQRHVDVFNRDEALWRVLEPRKKKRRKNQHLTKKQHESLDRLEFAAERPPDDCIAMQ